MGRLRRPGISLVVISERRLPVKLLKAQLVAEAEKEKKTNYP